MGDANSKDENLEEELINNDGEVRNEGEGVESPILNLHGETKENVELDSEETGHPPGSQPTTEEEEDDDDVTSDTTVVDEGNSNNNNPSGTSADDPKDDGCEKNIEKTSSFEDCIELSSPEDDPEPELNETEDVKEQKSKSDTLLQAVAKIKQEEKAKSTGLLSLMAMASSSQEEEDDTSPLKQSLYMAFTRKTHFDQITGNTLSTPTPKVYDSEKPPFSYPSASESKTNEKKNYADDSQLAKKKKVPTATLR